MFERDIVFIDTETTSKSVMTAKICQLSLMKVDVNLNVTHRLTTLINPGVKMPKGARAVHGITDEMLKSAVTFKDIAKQFVLYLKDCDIAGYNISKFDLPVIFKELTAAGVYLPANFRVYDVMTIFHKFNGRTLTDAYRHYLFQDLENAHDASADNVAALEVFKAQIKRHWPQGTTPQELHEFTFGGNPVDMEGLFLEVDDPESPTGKTIVFNFGEHKGEPVGTQLKYLRWVANKPEFSNHVRAIAEELYEQTYHQ